MYKSLYFQTLQSCPISSCTNEPDTLSNNNDSLQTTPDSTLQKPTSLQQQTQQLQNHLTNLHNASNNNNHSNNNNNNNNEETLHHHHHHHQHSTNSATSDTSSTSFHQRFDFSQLKARLPELNCLHSLQRYWQQHNGGNNNNSGGGATDPNDPTANKDDGGVSNSFYANNILGYTFGYQFGGKDTQGNGKGEPVRETPLQKFYRHQQQKKMPAFRGRRGWCGCFQVSFSGRLGYLWY